jgi:predicted phage-related endonuclease
MSEYHQGGDAGVGTKVLQPASYEEALAAWLDSRRDYIGGSEAFELLERAQYGRGCKRALGYRKLGAEPDVKPTEEDEALWRRGQIMEPILASEYTRLTGRKLRRLPMDDWGFPRVRLHREHLWAGVSTDRLILGEKSPGDLEAKSRGEGPFYRVLRQGPFDGDLLQVQWSTWVTGHTWGALVIIGVFGALPVIHFDVNADREVHEIFEREGSEFAAQVWGKGEPPEPTFAATDKRCRVCEYRLTCRGEQIDQAEAAVLRQVSRSAKDLVQISDDALAHTLADIDLLKEEAKSIEASLDIARQRALDELGEVDAAYLHGYGKVYRMPSQANYLDVDKLKSLEPDIYERFFVHRLTGNYYLRTYPQK